MKNKFLYQFPAPAAKEPHLKRRVKPESFFIMPRSDETISFSSNKTIGIVDPKTKAGHLYMGSGEVHSGSHMALAGPPEFVDVPFGFFPDDFVQKCLEACPSLGGETEIATGFTMMHTITVIK
jgi:hypothetical protein